MKEKTFYKTLVSFNLDPNKIKTILKDKRLTATEKLILEAHMELRNNQNNKAIALLEKIPPSDLLFVESQRLLILGCASNNLSYFKKAEDYLLQSAKILKEMKINDFLFSAYSSLFWIYANLNEVSKMKNMLDELVAMPQDIEVHKIRLLRCQFCYYQMAGEDKQAHKILNKLEAVKSSIVEKDIIAYLIDKFMFYVHIENFDKCYETLADMKNYRKFHLSENYNYMKKLLDHLTKDVPLYAYIEEFEAAPLLFHQIKVIQALEERRPDIAHYHWDWLRATSELYQDQFVYKGLKSLFSLAIDKHRAEFLDKPQVKIPDNIPKLDALITLLTKAKKPLSAGFIYEALWGEAAEEKEDLKKISRLVSRAKFEKDLEIEYRKGTYILKSKATSKAS